MTRAASLAQMGSNSLTMRNRIINGNMAIDQRNAGASVTPTSGQYTLDRFFAQLTQASKFTVQQNAGTVTPPTGYTKYLGITVGASANVTIGSGDLFGVSQVIEGFNIADLGWGTASAAPVTLSFWVRCSVTGTFGGTLINGAFNRSYPFTYTVSSANTWEQKTVTIAGDTSGTWSTDNSYGLGIRFSLGAGSTYSGTAGSWSGNTYYSATGAATPITTNSATFYITGVQLEAGTTATPFETRPYGMELALCQRYYWKWLNNTGGNRYIANVQAYGSVGVFGKLFDLPVQMRTQPTCSKSGTITVFKADSTSAGNPSIVALNQVTTLSIGCDDMYSGLSGLVAGNCSVISMAANGYFDASAEL